VQEWTFVLAYNDGVRGGRRCSVVDNGADESESLLCGEGHLGLCLAVVSRDPAYSLPWHHT